MVKKETKAEKKIEKKHEEHVSAKALLVRAGLNAGLAAAEEMRK